MELLDLSPKAATSQAMKKQMVAERERRGEFIRSEGKKAAMRLTAEGNKLVAINMGLAEQEATRKRSEGNSGAKVELAMAESFALETVADVIKSEGGSHVDYMISKKYLGFLSTSTRANDTKTIYFPYRIQSLTGIINNLVHAYGAKNMSNSSSPKRKEVPKQSMKAVVEDFSELN